MKLCSLCKNTYPDDYQTCPRDQSPLVTLGAEIVPGAVLRGKYEVLSELGAGGMATVYKVRHRAFHELAAVKVVHAQFMHDPGFIKRFRNEAVVARQLKHPNAVRIDDFDYTEDGRPFIVMEFVDGRSLYDVRKEAPGPWPVDRCIDIVSQAAEALGAAHTLGIVHRDIKPANIVLLRGEDGALKVKVLDFGIAKVSSATAFAGMTSVLTQQSLVIGTPEYMSPEQANGHLEAGIDGRSDLYSLGLVLYEMLTGAHPFQADTPMGMLIQQLNTVPAPPESIAAVPSAISALVLKCLQKDPRQRFQSAAEMLKALRDPQGWCAPLLPVPAISFGTPQPVKPVAPALSANPPFGPALSFIGTRRKYPALGTVVATILSIFGLWAGYSHRSTQGVKAPNLPPVQTYPDRAIPSQPTVPVDLPTQPQSTLPGADAKPLPEAGKGVARQVVGKQTPFADPQKDAAALGVRAKKSITAKRYVEAFPLAKAACDGGNAVGCSSLGDLYEYGWGVSPDHAAALTLHRKGCERGDRSGCMNLFGLLSRFTQTEQEENESLLRRLCKSGNEGSCGALVFWSIMKPSVNVSEAAAFFRKSCDHGDTESCGELGGMYDRGQGVVKNASEVARLYRKSCAGGDGFVCYELGSMYTEGKGVVKDSSEASTFYSRAVKLYRSSCDKGDAVSCWNLGNCYSTGTGLPMDQTQAATMYNKACRGGFSAGCRASEQQKATGNP